MYYIKYYRDSKEKYTIATQSEEVAYFSSVVSRHICTYLILKLHYLLTFSLNQSGRLLIKSHLFQNPRKLRTHS